MGHPFSSFFKKADKAFSAFAKSKAALPVLITSISVVAIACVAVYFVTAEDDTVSSLGASSVTSGMTTTQQDVVGEEDYTSTSIDTAVYAGTVLPEGEDAGEDYIENTLFLGDSNTYRYMNYGFADLSNAVGVVGMGVGGIESLDCVKFKSYKNFVTIPEALPIMQPQRVVFGFGTNNLGGNVASFIETYEEGIQACYEAYPYFDIILTAVPPVDKYSAYTNVKMSDIDAFNEAIVEMCEANGWKFLNTSEVLKDPDTGYAKTEYTISDGLHFSLEGCTTLFDYIRTHPFETEDIRPKPLDAILARDETPPDLITEDPLKTPGSSSSSASTSVSVYFAAGTGGYLTGTLDQTITKGGTTSEVTAVAFDGYFFSGWSCSYGGLSSTSAASVTYTAPSDISAFGGVVVTAVFTEMTVETHTVTFTLAGDTEGASLSDTKKTVDDGKDASVTLTLQDGYTASVSDGSLSGSTVKVSNVTSDVTVTITITAETPEATATPDPSATATPAPTLDPSATATPTPTVAPGATATPAPTAAPTATPAPTAAPTAAPTPAPTAAPTATPEPTAAPAAPTEPPAPTEQPTDGGGEE